MRSRLRSLTTLAVLVVLSLIVRRPLFNKELTTNWEFVSAHVLITNQLWYQTPSAVHHFNLLYTFPRPEDKFIDDLGTSGVADRFGNYYYISLPHLGYLTSYLFFLATGQAPSMPGLQIFALLVHFITCTLLYKLARSVTEGWRGSRLASLAAFCVLLFAPEALFYYQNGVVGSMLVVPYTIGLLLALTVLVSERDTSRFLRGISWLAFALCVVLGCLTDWHAYFTAFSTVLVVFWQIRSKRIRTSTGLSIIVLCCLCVCLAGAIFVWQNSRIGGFDLFLQTIRGRVNERVGASSKGMGLNTLDYYRSLGRYYLGYAPFLLAGALLMLVSIRNGGRRTFRAVLQSVGLPLSISAFAVVLDHVVLANNTAGHSFATLSDLVPISLFVSVAVLGFIETSVTGLRSSLMVWGLLAVSAAAGVAAYYFVYLNRPHPFRTAAATILAAAEPSDVMFSTSEGSTVRQMIYYLGRNILVVSDQGEAANYLTCRQLPRGTLVRLRDDWTVEGTEVVLPSRDVCHKTQETARR